MEYIYFGIFIAQVFAAVYVHFKWEKIIENNKHKDVIIASKDTKNFIWLYIILYMFCFIFSPLLLLGMIVDEYIVPLFKKGAKK